jgi:hypothetical protein
MLRNVGTTLFLPYFDFDRPEFEQEDEARELIWTKEAISFGKRFVALLVALDDACRCKASVTVAPDWSGSAEYRFRIEDKRDAKIANLEEQIEELQREIALQRVMADTHTALRGLLYESGKPLENAVRQALSLLGFDVAHVANGENEFDAVFVSGEGRFIGEFEGKDSKAVSIAKLSQLKRNIQEDFERDEVEAHAKGVLFANAHRLSDPKERGDFFTTKVYTGAKRAGVALVRTPDLFEVSRYLIENIDPAFARECREAMANAAGEIVEFPKPKDLGTQTKTASVRRGKSRRSDTAG